MTLEDHLGDLVRKSRLMLNAEPADLATAAGLSEQELAALEDSGQPPEGLDYLRLARALALHPTKLQAFANGWLPPPITTEAWRQLRQITTARNMAVHCYLVWDEASRTAALFDTGFDPAPVFQLLEENGLKLVHLFITHGHHDHVESLPAIRQRFPGVRVHTDMQGAPAHSRNDRGEIITLGRLHISNRDTPGHAPDGVTYVITGWSGGVPPVAMVGDAIFAGSMGGAKEHGELAKAKVREQILSLPAATLLCPGHGPLTTVEEEKRHNPFF